MSSSRTKCLSTKLTEAEYATLERAAGAETLSAWARAMLLHAAASASPGRDVGERCAMGSDAPRADARSDAAGGRPQAPPAEDRIRPPAHDHIAFAAERLPYYPTVAVGWRPRPTDWSSWDPDRAAHGPLLRSPAWLLAMALLGCLSAVGISAYRYARIWTPLQRQYLTSYVWSAVAISRSGSYELLVIVDRTERRTAVDADVSVTPTWGFGLSPRAVSHGAEGLTWQRSEWDHAALHAFLRRAIYQDQTLLDLARPVLWWGAVAVLVAALVLAVSDTIARGGITAPRSVWARSPDGSTRAWKAWYRQLVHRKASRP